MRVPQQTTSERVEVVVGAVILRAALCTLAVVTPRWPITSSVMVRTRATAGTFDMNASGGSQPTKKRGRPPKVDSDSIGVGDPQTKEANSPTPKRKSTKSMTVEAASSNVPEPPDWRATYDLITELRADRTAVVDSMGSEAIAEEARPEDRAYQTLISLMLSSQTKDTINMATMKKLRAHPDGLSVQSVMAMPDETLHEYIRQVGFHNNKVRFIKESTKLLVEKHDGKVPQTMDELLELPGVGPKMAIILLRVAFDQCVGISVDTHVHRISNQLGWAGAKGTKQPEQTRKVLESWMPRDIWPDVNLLLVGLGQEMQTEKPKLLTKCLACSDPPRALKLAAAIGIDVKKELQKNGLEAPTDEGR